MIDLSIVIVTYNAKEYLLACLRSIYQYPPDVSYEVIVVDNASTDGVPEAVRQSFPQVKLMASQENHGFAWANNQGIQISSGRYVLFLNPDTEAPEKALSGLVRFADAHQDVSAFTCRLLNSDGTLQLSCFRFPNLRMAFYGFFPIVPMDAIVNGRYPIEDFDRVFEPEHVLGACLMVKHDALKDLGGWDEGFFMYFEETDLCYRLKKKRHTTLYTPEVSIVHHGQRSTSTEREKMSVAFYRSQAYFYRKHYGIIKTIALKAVVFFGLLFWTARSCVSFLRRRIDWPLFRTRLSGYLKILLV